MTIRRCKINDSSRKTLQEAMSKYFETALSNAKNEGMNGIRSTNESTYICMDKRDPNGNCNAVEIAEVKNKKDSKPKPYYELSFTSENDHKRYKLRVGDELKLYRGRQEESLIFYLKGDTANYENVPHVRLLKAKVFLLMHTFGKTILDVDICGK